MANGNGLNLQTFVPPTPLAAPPPSNGGGNFFQDLLGGGFGNFLQTGFGVFQQTQAAKEARKAEKRAAEREFELERLRILNQGSAPPPIAPVAPVSLPAGGFGGAPLVPGVNVPLLLGGVALLAVALLMRRR